MKNSVLAKKRLSGAVLIAVFSALLCVLSPFTVPVFTIPFSLGVFAVCCVSVVIQTKGVFSTLMYILLGALGLPVFAAFSGGIGVLTGPTGGFILGYVPFALIIGVVSGKTTKYHWLFLSAVGGLAVLYILGGLWYTYTAEVSLWQGLTVSVFPFIIPDIIKILMAVWLGTKIKKTVRQKKGGVL